MATKKSESCHTEKEYRPKYGTVIAARVAFAHTGRLFDQLGVFITVDVLWASIYSVLSLRAYLSYSRIPYKLTFLTTPVEAPVGIFGVPLDDSINYANVAISLTDENGKSYVYGYVPIVIAKCGVFLKERGKW